MTNEPVTTIDAAAPAEAGLLREWALLLRGLVKAHDAICMSVKFTTPAGSTVRLSYDRSNGCTLLVGGRSLSLPDEWIDGATLTAPPAGTG